MKAYTPPPAVATLAHDEHQRILRQLQSWRLDVPELCERLWLQSRDLDIRWTCHAAVRTCAMACTKLGLHTADITHAITSQRDELLREARQVVLPRDAVAAAQWIVFLAHRGEGPRELEYKIRRATTQDPAWSVYCAVRTLAVLTARSRLNPVDVHEALRQVRDRLVGPTGGERSIWVPESYA